MSELRWVQHISGQGEKWELSDGKNCIGYSVWYVVPKLEGNFNPVLPKSEYRLCEPPEVWVDVTDRCAVNEYALNGIEFWSIIHGGGDECLPNVLSKSNGYRVRKVQLYAVQVENHQPVHVAFIIEKRRQP